VRQDAARTGWTPDLASRALTGFRIAAAVALGKPVAQPLVERGTPERVGQVMMPRGLWRRKQALLSASTTAPRIERELARADGGRADPTLEQLRESLRAFSEARYSRDGRVDGAALEGALVRGMAAIRRLRLKRLWRGPSTRAFRQTAASL
jgi:hypothetical protein